MYNVSIRPLELSDANVSWEWRNDSEIWKYTFSKPDKYITPLIERDWIKKVIAVKTSRRFAIIVDAVYVGNIQLTNIIEGEKVYYHIFIGDKNYWGKGVAKAATFQILSFAKDVLDLKCVFLEVKKENLSAIKLYKNIGFRILEESDKIIEMKILL